MNFNNIYHKPVMLNESIEGLNININGIYIDATLGGGGHSNCILDKLLHGQLIVFDHDQESFNNLPNKSHVKLIPYNFKHINSYCKSLNIKYIDGLIADLGMSSHQLNSKSRGFSMKYDAVLDMRMDKRSFKKAYTIINTYSYNNLVKVFSKYGEIRNSKTLANIIILARRKKFIKYVYDFINIIQYAIKGNKNKYLAKLFQSLRIEVNDEINALKSLIIGCEKLLKKGGRLVIISYHSIEDRIVKNYTKYGNFKGILYKDIYGNIINKSPFKMINSKPITPNNNEIKMNSRARSAKLRIVEKL